MLSRTHGSAIFTRGETQALAVTTLGTPSDEQKIETLVGETFKSFMLHYNFPPYSVGETRPLRAPTPGNRPRRPGGAGHLPGAAVRGRVPLYHPHRVRDPLLQRLLLDGHDLWRLHVTDGRRRAC